MQLLILLSMVSSSSRKRVDLPLKMIRKAEQHGITQVSVAKEFGVCTSQVLKAKEDILKQHMYNGDIWLIGTLLLVFRCPN